MINRLPLGYPFGDDCPKSSTNALLTPVGTMRRAMRVVEQHRLPVELAELEAHHLAGGNVEQLLAAAVKHSNQVFPPIDITTLTPGESIKLAAIAYPLLIDRLTVWAVGCDEAIPLVS